MARESVRLGRHGDVWVYACMAGIHDAATGLATLGGPPDPEVMFEEHGADETCQYLQLWPEGQLNPGVGPQAQLPREFREELAQRCNSDDPEIQLHAVLSAFAMEDPDVVNELIKSLRRSLAPGGGGVWLVQATKRYERRRTMIRLLHAAQAQPLLPLGAFVGERQPLVDHAAGRGSAEHLFRPIALLPSPHAAGIVGMRGVSAASETYLLLAWFGADRGMDIGEDDSTWAHVFQTGTLFLSPRMAGSAWIRQLNAPAAALPWQPLVTWWSRCLNELLTETTDLGRFKDADGVLDARAAYRASSTADRIFMNCSRIQVHTADHVGRISAAFEILDLLDAVVGRDGGARRIYATLAQPSSVERILRAAFKTAPMEIRDVLLARTQTVVETLTEETLANVVGDRRRPGGVLVGQVEQRLMPTDEYVGRLFQAMRDTHHGYQLRDVWKRDVLDTNAGHISVAFPELVVLLVIALTADARFAMSEGWFNEAAVAERLAEVPNQLE